MKDTIWESAWLARLVEWAGYAVATAAVGAIVLFALVAFRTLVYRLVGIP